MITAVDTSVLIDILEGDPEFGAHAAAQADRLLTRDQDFHRRHFEGLTVAAPRR